MKGVVSVEGFEPPLSWTQITRLSKLGYTEISKNQNLHSHIDYLLKSTYQFRPSSTIPLDFDFIK